MAKSEQLYILRHNKAVTRATLSSAKTHAQSLADRDRVPYVILKLVQTVRHTPTAFDDIDILRASGYTLSSGNPSSNVSPKPYWHYYDSQDVVDVHECDTFAEVVQSALSDLKSRYPDIALSGERKDG
jgi:hypothetical protein